MLTRQFMDNQSCQSHWTAMCRDYHGTRCEIRDTRYEIRDARCEMNTCRGDWLYARNLRVKAHAGEAIAGSTRSLRIAAQQPLPLKRLQPCHRSLQRPPPAPDTETSERFPACGDTHGHTMRASLLLSRSAMNRSRCFKFRTNDHQSHRVRGGCIYSHPARGR
jgi:hypothetical protein